MQSAPNGSRRIASLPYSLAHQRWPTRAMRDHSQASRRSSSALVRRITVAQDRVRSKSTGTALADRLLDQEAALPRQRRRNRRPIVIEVPVRFRRRGVEAKLMVLDQPVTRLRRTPISSRLSRALMSGSAGSSVARRTGLATSHAPSGFAGLMLPACSAWLFSRPK